MQLRSDENAGGSSPINAPEDPQHLDEIHTDDDADHSDSDEAGQSSGQSSGQSLDEPGHSSFSGAGQSSGQSSGLSEGGGPSSEQVVLMEGSVCHNGESSASTGIQWPLDAPPGMGGRAPERSLCHVHKQQAGLRSRNMNTVACQTDETKDYSPIVFEISADDPSCSEGTLRLMIQNFRNMSDTVRGPTKRIQGVLWRIMVMPRQHVVQKKGTQKCLGFFLQCCPEAYSDSWSCQASAELRLISQKPGVPHFTRKTNHVYTAKENDWGYSCFMTWADILDESQGYIKDDRVVLEVTVKADPPENIVGLEEFRKVVQNWVDLASLQFKRGKIDLAIEANGQGLKYCKDKDADSRRKLEDQKREFIEKKLEESIQRIETAQKKENSDEPDGVSNQTALRMALTSNNNKNKNKNNKKFQKNMRPRAPTPNNQTKATANNAVKTENAKTVQQQAQPVKKEPTPQTGKKTDKIDDAKKESDEQKKDVKIDINKKALKKVRGDYNRKFIKKRITVSWARRTKDEEEMLTDAACYLATEADLASQEKDNFVMKYMTDQMKALTYPDIKDGRKKLLYNMHQLRSFAESAFEVEMQRQTIIRKATAVAREYMRAFNANLAANPNPAPPGPDFVPIEWDLNVLWNENKAVKRAKIIDREAGFLDAKIRLFWDALGGMEKFLESDSSDHDSISSSSESSDRQNDGCLKPKRTRLDFVCECCVREQLQSYPTTCDSEVQTEDVQKSLNASRCQPTDVVRKAKSVATSMKSTAHAAQQTPKKSTQTSEAASNNSTPTGRKTDPEASRPKSAAASTDTSRDSDDDDEGDEDEDVDVEDNGSSPPFNFEFGGPDSNQVINALSTVAMNMMNTRRIINKAEEFMIVIAKNSNDVNFRTALRDISKVSGIAYVENEEKFRPSSPLLSPDFGEEDFATLYSKLMSDEHRELIVMNQQVEKFDNYKKQLNNYMFLDQDDVDRLIKGSRCVNTKIADYEKKLKDFQKQNEELEAKHKKVEKQLREELKTAKSHNNQEKDRNNQLNKEIKEKAKQIKNLEGRTQSLQTERNEFLEKQKQAQKELAGVQKRLSDDSQKFKREIQQLQDQKKGLQNELNNRDHECKQQNNQLEERNRELKKMKEELACEKNKVNQLQQVSVSHQERAKKSEIALLQYQLDAGLSLLDRAMVDANKKMKEMEDAASNRARSANEVHLCMQSRDEWASIIDEIKNSIDSTKLEHEGQIEAIKNGKPMSALPKIAVPKPPPAPQLVKVAPIAPVEPTKPVPGVIGSKPSQSTAQSSASSSSGATSSTADRNANKGSTLQARSASPVNRAPGSPVNKPSSSTATAGTSSPARHAPIGTRPNGTVANGCSAETNSLATSNLPWTSWSDSFASLTETLTIGKKAAPEERSSLFSSDLLGGMSTGLGASSTWSNDDTWSNAVSSITNNYNASSSSNVGSFMNPLNLHPSNLQQQVSQQSTQAHQSSSQMSHQPNSHSLQHQSLQQQHHHPSSQQHQQQQQQHAAAAQQYSAGWGNYPEAHVHRQYMFRQQQNYQQAVATIAKKIGLDLEKTNEVIADFCREHKLHYQNITGEDSVAEKIREYFTKRNSTFRMSAPPGAAPGYMTNPLVSMDRPPYNLMGDNHQMNDRNGGGVPGMDKW